jgi:hypothetical protein
LFLSSVYLGINKTAETSGEIASFDWFSAVGLGTIIMGIGSLLILFLTVRQHNNVKYLDFIRNTDTEISQLIKEELTLKNKNECVIYAYNYIDLCDRILFLIQNKAVQKSFKAYYFDFFNYAITIMWWYSKMVPEDRHSFKISWSALKKWIEEEEEITPYPLMHLPEEMKKAFGDDKISLEKDPSIILKELTEVFNLNKN